MVYIYYEWKSCIYIHNEAEWQTWHSNQISCLVIMVLPVLKQGLIATAVQRSECFKIITIIIIAADVCDLKSPIIQLHSNSKGNISSCHGRFQCFINTFHFNEKVKRVSAVPGLWIDRWLRMGRRCRCFKMEQIIAISGDCITLPICISRMAKVHISWLPLKCLTFIITSSWSSSQKSHLWGICYAVQSTTYMGCNGTPLLIALKPCKLDIFCFRNFRNLQTVLQRGSHEDMRMQNCCCRK